MPPTHAPILGPTTQMSWCDTVARRKCRAPTRHTGKNEARGLAWGLHTPLQGPCQGGWHAPCYSKNRAGPLARDVLMQEPCQAVGMQRANARPVPGRWHETC